MSKFRKKPVVIDALRFQDRSSYNAMVVEWGDSFASVARFDNGVLTIKTLETHNTPLIASPGDWIVRGVKGEFYPCRSDIFEETYEAAE